jgi:hypothetical protein
VNLAKLASVSRAQVYIGDPDFVTNTLYIFAQSARLGGNYSSVSEVSDKLLSVLSVSGFDFNYDGKAFLAFANCTMHSGDIIACEKATGCLYQISSCGFIGSVGNISFEWTGAKKPKVRSPERSSKVSTDPTSMVAIVIVVLVVLLAIGFLYHRRRLKLSLRQGKLTESAVPSAPVDTLNTATSCSTDDASDEGDDDLWATLDHLALDFGGDCDDMVATSGAGITPVARQKKVPQEKQAREHRYNRNTKARAAARQLGSAPPQNESLTRSKQRKFPTNTPTVDRTTGATKYAYGEVPADIDLDHMDMDTARTTLGAMVGSSAAPWRHGNIKFSEAVKHLRGHRVGAFILSNVQLREHCLTVVVQDSSSRCAHFKIETREQMSNIPVISINGTSVGEYRTVEDMVEDLLEDTRGILPVQLKFDTSLPLSSTSQFMPAGTAKYGSTAWSVELDEIEF